MAGACVTVDLSPACVHLKGIRAGDRNTFAIRLNQDGIPLDLTGLTLTSQARKSAKTPDPPAIVAEVTVTDAEAGELMIRWPGADVTALMNGAGSFSGVWDLQSLSVGEDPLTLVAGKFSAVMDVTR